MSEKIYHLAVDVTLRAISGKWKTSIICNLGTKSMRTNELKRQMPGISQRILTKQLKELEEDKIVIRKVYPEVPPRVEYCLSENGNNLRKILLEMSHWGERQIEILKENGQEVKVLDDNLAGFEESK